MIEIKKEESGWLVALSWLFAIEEAARDFHGTRARVFCKRVYDHSVQHYLRMLGNEYGIRVEKTDTIQTAVESYIHLGVQSGLLASRNEFDLDAPNPHHLNICVHQCEYLKSCQSLIDAGFGIRELTCPRIGCFQAAVGLLADIDCDYEVRSFNVNGDCQGTIERI